MSILKTLLRPLYFGAETPGDWAAGRINRDIFGVTPASSGVNVTDDAALGYGPWWRAIELISNTIAKSRMAVLKYDGKRKVPDPSHPAHRLVYTKPAEGMTAFHFWKTIVAHKLTAGNAYAYIERDAMMRPTSLVLIDPKQLTPVLADGKLYYRIVQSGKQRLLYPYEVLHFKGLSYDGLIGYSVVTKARESLGGGIGARTHATVYFKNGGRPSVVLTFPGNIPPQDRTDIAASWERMHAGLDNAHKTAVIDKGGDVKQMAFSAVDSQLLESRAFSIREVSNYTGTPPHKLGDIGRQGYASLEQENLSFFTDTLSPIQAEIEHECDDKLLSEEEKLRESHSCEWVNDSLRWLDTTTKTTYVRTALGGQPWITPNEGREAFGLQPDEAPGMDDIPKPLNMKQGAGDQGDQGGNKPANDGQQTDQGQGSAQAIAADVIQATAARLLTRIEHQAGASAKSAGKFVEWADAIEQANAAQWRDEFRTAERAAEQAAGVSRPLAAAWLAEVATAFRCVADHASEKMLAGQTQEAINQLRARVPAFAQECLR